MAQLYNAKLTGRNRLVDRLIMRQCGQTVRESFTYSVGAEFKFYRYY